MASLRASLQSEPVKLVRARGMVKPRTNRRKDRRLEDAKCRRNNGQWALARVGPGPAMRDVRRNASEAARGRGPCLSSALFRAPRGERDDTRVRHPAGVGPAESPGKATCSIESMPSSADVRRDSSDNSRALGLDTRARSPRAARHGTAARSQRHHRASIVTAFFHRVVKTLFALSRARSREL